MAVAVVWDGQFLEDGAHVGLDGSFAEAQAEPPEATSDTECRAFTCWDSRIIGRSGVDSRSRSAARAPSCRRRTTRAEAVDISG
ncbi:hypothetical protein [Actinomadura sp. 3N508]|uniref:hypothetical protein n=1 Tax=Actinomadura sp. 3N508 TaxID=3375153 RepID=UPI0037BDA8E3